MTQRLVVLFAAAVASAIALGCSDDVGTEADDESSGASEGALKDRGRLMTEAEVANITRQAGFEESLIPTMVCTAKYESGWYEKNTNNNTNGTTDYGLFQINSVHIGGTNGCPTSAEPLFTASINAKCALAIYKMQGIKAWYGYKAHKDECDSYQLGPEAARPGPAPAPNPGNPQGPNGGTPGGQPDQPGGQGCFSPSAGTDVPDGACVQARSNQRWYQCSEGNWYAADASGATGPAGPCTPKYPLR